MRTSSGIRVLGVVALASWGLLTGCNSLAGDLDCPAGQTDCGGFCVNLLHSQDHCGLCGEACPQNAACSNGVCRQWCPTGTTPCGEACVYLVSDDANCGACGVECAAGTVCRNGVCSSGCATGSTSCGDGCIDLLSDRNNCGSCGVACPNGTFCSAGRCIDAGGRNRHPRVDAHLMEGAEREIRERLS